MFGKPSNPAPAVVAPTTAPAVGTGEWFKNFGDQKPNGGGSFIAAGGYVMEMQKCLRQISENDGNGTVGHQLLIFEFIVREVLVRFDACTLPTGQVYEASNRVGENCSLVLNMTKNAKTAGGDAKGILLAMAKNEDPNIHNGSFTPAEWQQHLMTFSEPPGEKVKGILLRCAGSRILTKREKKPFVRLNWFPHAVQLDNNTITGGVTAE